MINDHRPDRGAWVDPATVDLYWPSWAALERERLAELVAEVCRQLDAGRPFHIIAAELRRVADQADRASATIGRYDVGTGEPLERLLDAVWDADDLLDRQAA